MEWPAPPARSRWAGVGLFGVGSAPLLIGLASCGEVEWCERGDSNPHGIATASPSSWCVCQFRHFREGETAYVFGCSVADAVLRRCGAGAVEPGVALPAGVGAGV